MYLQGPWALVEIEGGDGHRARLVPAAGDRRSRGLRIRVNIDLSLWIPEQADQKEGARAPAAPDAPRDQFPYNEMALAFSTTDDAPG